MNDRSKKSQYANALTAQEREFEALERARSYLKEKGIHPPTQTDFNDPLAFYDAIRQYSEDEANLIMKFLREHDKKEVQSTDEPIQTYHWQNER